MLFFIVPKVQNVCCINITTICVKLVYHHILHNGYNRHTYCAIMICGKGILEQTLHSNDKSIKVENIVKQETIKAILYTIFFHILYMANEIFIFFPMHFCNKEKLLSFFYALRQFACSVWPRRPGPIN